MRLAGDILGRLAAGAAASGVVGGSSVAAHMEMAGEDLHSVKFGICCTC